MVENLITQSNQDIIEAKMKKEVEELHDTIKVLAEQNLMNLEEKTEQLIKRIEEDVNYSIKIEKFLKTVILDNSSHYSTNG